MSRSTSLTPWQAICTVTEALAKGQATAEQVMKDAGYIK